MKYKPLTEKQVTDTIDGKGFSNRIPILLHFWVHPEEFRQRQSQVLEILDSYPHDVQRMFINTPDLKTIRPIAG